MCYVNIRFQSVLRLTRFIAVIYKEVIFLEFCVKNSEIGSKKKLRQLAEK